MSDRLGCRRRRGPVQSRSCDSGYIFAVSIISTTEDGLGVRPGGRALTQHVQDRGSTPSAHIHT